MHRTPRSPGLAQECPSGRDLITTRTRLGPGAPYLRREALLRDARRRTWQKSRRFPSGVWASMEQILFSAEPARVGPLLAAAAAAQRRRN